MKYDVDYFLRFFKDIPEESFSHLMQDGEKRCYIGWAKSEDNRSAYLVDLLHKINTTAGALAWNKDYRYSHLSFKGRIIVALSDVKEKLEPEVKERIVYVKMENIPVDLVENYN